jgi:hypothetical protein
MRRTIDNPAAFGNIFEGTPYRLSKSGYPAYSRRLKDTSGDNIQISNSSNSVTTEPTIQITPSQKLLTARNTETALIPINRIDAYDGNVTFRRSPIAKTIQNIRTVNDIRPLQQKPSR